MKIEFQKSDFGETEPLNPSALIAAGWFYIDPPTRFSHEMWDYFLNLLGVGNYRILAMTEGTAADGFKYKRGQLLINPTAQENVKRHAEAVKQKEPGR